MSLRVVVLRIVRTTAVSLLTLLLLAIVLVQVRNRPIRRQSERLLADFQSIRLNQTSWPEAQAIMQRWGNLGHAHGPCNSTDCAYDITVLGWPSLLPTGTAAPWLYHCCGRFPSLLQLVGIRFTALELRFLVKDGAVRRAHLSLMAETEDAGGYIFALLVTVSSNASLDQALNTVGSDEELGVHPDFIVGPDGSCTGCEKISLVYTPQISADELVRLTSFNLSCFTRLLPCLHLSALAPALMREDAANLQHVPLNSVPCTTRFGHWPVMREPSG